METAELRRMRRNQFAVLKGLLIIGLFLFFIIMNMYTISIAHFFLFLGIFVLTQGIFGLMKGDSTKSIIPIVEKVAIYEKQKMGKEWYKHRKVSYGYNIVLSGILFWQSYINWGYEDNIFKVDLLFMVTMFCFLLVLANVSLIIHNRKVDRAASEVEFKTYTWKVNLLAIILGIVFAMMLLIAILILVL
ncbi:hypothetical protein MKZ01_07135 [Lysinibacillus endophyticus]|uniref:hypothetical protein n=1 Tax=Ureibacillus endophyticus TaxID=1978490 RepID=UPI003135995C